MDANPNLEFDFQGVDRAALLAEAKYTLKGLPSELGDTSFSPDTPSPADHLLEQLGQSLAEFSTTPETYELKERHFVEHGLKVPLRFNDLRKEFRFYWVRFPLILKPLDDMPFIRLKCGLEFNPGMPGHLRPRAHTILPNKKFKTLMTANDELELGIGENFDFETSAGIPEMQVGQSRVQAQGGVDVKAAGKLGLMVGPFKYTLKKAQIDHTDTGAEKIFWTLDGKEFFEEDTPPLLVVLQIPKQTSQVTIAAAVQATHRFNLGAAGLSAHLRYFTDVMANFFRKGAPTDPRPKTLELDLTPSL